MNLDPGPGIDLNADLYTTVNDVAHLLRRLKRRHARRLGDSELTVRELARKTGYAVGTIGAYFTGRTLPPTDRFDVLIQVFGADEAEQRAMATIRDKIAERIRWSAGPLSGPVLGQHPIDLPPTNSAFVGRDAELERIVTHLASRASAGARIAVIHGPPGSGRTQLAVQAGNRLLDSYPHGCLFVDLRDITPAQDPHEAAARILRRLGLPPDVVPDDPSERTAVYRRVMRERRVLLILDNADGGSSVVPLVPSGGGAGVLVVARNPLRVLDEALVVGLTGLRREDARTVFLHVAAGAAVSDTLVDRALAACQYLPLAIRVAAARVRGQSPSVAADLLSDLEDDARSLTVLDDGGRSVARSFEAACAALPGDLATTFATLSVHPGRTLDAWAVAAMTGAAESDAARALVDLADAALVEPDGAGDYTIHDLVRAASAAHAVHTLPAQAVRAAERRLLEACLAAVQHADVLAAPSRYRPESVRPAAGTPLPPFGTPALATAWLDRRQDTLVLLVELAARSGRPDVCWKMAYAMRDQFFRTRATGPWIRTHILALTAAEECGDRWAVAVITNSLGLAHAFSGRIASADEFYHRALALFRALGDVHGEANAHRHLAWTAYVCGDTAEAMTRACAALEIYRSVGVVRDAAITLRTLALAEAARGQTQAAVVHLAEAHRVFQARGLVADEAMALNGLGEVTAAESAAGSFAYHVAAWRRARAGDFRSEEARALRGMAKAAVEFGRDGAAMRLRARADRLDYQPPGLRAGVYLVGPAGS